VGPGSRRDTVREAAVSLHDGEMPRHRWTCFACGEDNVAEVETCGVCSCPASPTSNEIRAKRADHVQHGGALRGDALMNRQSDLSAFDVLGCPLLFVLFGWWRR